MSFFIQDAYAQAGGAAQPNILLQLLPLVALFVIFYFMLIRPQQKRAKQHKAMVEALKSGDEVITAGGIVGRIAKVDDNYISLSIDGKTEVRMQRHSVTQVLPKGSLKDA